MKTKKLAGEAGLEIVDINLKRLLSSDEFIKEVKGLVTLNGVVFIRGQFLSIEEHVHLASYFGELEESHPLIKNTTAHENVFQIDYTASREYKPFDKYKSKSSKGGASGVAWHTDMTFMDIPPRFSILNAVSMPDYGGDTIWSNQTAAFYDLSEPMQSMLCELNAFHTSMMIGESSTSSLHPVVIRHPESGLPCLYVNETFTTRIKELSKQESDVILQMLFKHCSQHKFSVRYSWTVGDVAIWDNRSTQHAVVGDFGSQHRVIQRISTIGCPLEKFNM